MSCLYIALYGEINNPVLCARPCEGDYCIEHLKVMRAVDEVDRVLQETIRERRTKNL